MKKYLTKKQVQDLYQISQGTFYKWLREGMPYLKKGGIRRYSMVKINRWMRLHENPENDNLGFDETKKK